MKQIYLSWGQNVLKKEFMVQEDEEVQDGD